MHYSDDCVKFNQEDFPYSIFIKERKLRFVICFENGFKSTLTNNLFIFIFTFSLFDARLFFGFRS